MKLTSFSRFACIASVLLLASNLTQAAPCISKIIKMTDKNVQQLNKELDKAKRQADQHQLNYKNVRAAWSSLFKTYKKGPRSGAASIVRAGRINRRMPKI